MPTDKQVIEGLRELLAWEITDKQFPDRRKAYDLLARVKIASREKKLAPITKKYFDPLNDPSWLPIETIPRGEKVEALSVSGLTRTVTARSDQKIKNGRLYCWGATGSVTAIRWRPCASR